MIRTLHKKGKALTLGLLLISMGSLYAQNGTDLLKERMVADGFENVAVVQRGSDYYVTYENNLYVWNVDELHNAIEVAAGAVPDNGRLHIVTLKNKNPLLSTEVTVADWKAYKRGELPAAEMNDRILITNNTDEVYKVIREERQSNSSVGKVDLVLVPGMSLSNTKLYKTYDFLMSISPTLEFSLWKGNYFRGQVIIPFYNDDFGPLRGKVRPGFMTIEQNITLPKATYMRLTAGNFNSYRRGLDADLSRLFLNGDLEIGLNMGLTRYTEWDGFKYTTQSMSDLSYLGHIRYFYRPLDAELSVTGGQFYSGAKGMRFELVRHFRNVTIGGYALLGAGKTNGGFNFSVPLNIPKKYKRNHVRIKAASYFDWEYTYLNNEVLLQYYETRPNQNHSEHFFNSGFMKTQLLKQDK